MKFKVNLNESKFIPKNKSVFNFKILESVSPESIELYYDNIEISCDYGDRDYWTGSYNKCINTTVEYVLTVNKSEVEEVIVEQMFEDPAFQHLADDAFQAYIDENFDDLMEKYEKEIYAAFKDIAEEKANDEFDPYDYEADY